MATGFNPTGSDFVNADPTKTLYNVILEGNGTKDHYSFETGVKYETKIPRISNYDVDIATGAISGYLDGSGQSTVDDIVLSNIQLHLREHYAKETIDKKVAGLLEPGSDPEKLPLKDIIVALKGKALHLGNEKLIWQGESSTSFDGVLAQLSTGANYVADAIDYSTSTDAEILADIKSLVNKLEVTKPEFVNVDTIMSMSPAKFSAYSRALYNLNGAVSKETVGADGKPIQELWVPGTQIKAVSEIGLTGKLDIILTVPENIIVNYDLVDESEALDMLYNPFAKWYELTAEWKLGVKVVDAGDVIMSKTYVA